MDTIIVSRPGVTAQDVAAALRSTLSTRYAVTTNMTATGFGTATPADANVLLVKRNWLEQASVQITPVNETSEIRVRPGATYPGLIRLIHRVGLARKIHRILQNSPDLIGSD